jgi:hypothetical protein
LPLRCCADSQVQVCLFSLSMPFAWSRVKVLNVVELYLAAFVRFCRLAELSPYAS